MLDLDTRLARERDELLDALAQPPLARIGARAAAYRRRRRARRGGAALAAAAVVAVVGLAPWAGDGRPPPVAEDPDRSTVVYADAGITINGLTGTTVLDLPGAISDVQFTDQAHGYAVIACPARIPCAPSLTRTTDGGLTWTQAELPADTGELVAFPDGRLVYAGGVSADGGRSWQPTLRAAGRPPTVQQGQLLRVRGGTIEVWSPEYGNRGALAVQPADLAVSWVAATATADGAWWAGGLRGGAPAIAVTRDGGRTWTVTSLDADGSQARVATLGRHVYALALGPSGAIRAVLRSTDSGRTFIRPGGPVSLPAAMAGEAVPLLDGRLLVAGDDQRWYVSKDDGHSFVRANGTLPAVGRLARTPAGYVAYNLFNSSWAAFSADGATWRKLQLL